MQDRPNMPRPVAQVTVWSNLAVDEPPEDPDRIIGTVYQPRRVGAHATPHYINDVQRQEWLSWYNNIKQDVAHENPVQRVRVRVCPNIGQDVEWFEPPL